MTTDKMTRVWWRSVASHETNHGYVGSYAAFCRLVEGGHVFPVRQDDGGVYWVNGKLVPHYGTV